MNDDPSVNNTDSIRFGLYVFMCCMYVYCVVPTSEPTIFTATVAASAAVYTRRCLFVYIIVIISSTSKWCLCRATYAIYQITKMRNAGIISSSQQHKMPTCICLGTQYASVRVQSFPFSMDGSDAGRFHFGALLVYVCVCVPCARNMHITIYLFKSQHNAPLIHFIESLRSCRLIISN